MTVTFAALCETADALGVDVGVARRGDGHVITLIDFGRCRSLTIPVRRSFDAAVTVVCCSLALARDLPGCAGEGVRLAEAWPELAVLASAPTST